MAAVVEAVEEEMEAEVEVPKEEMETEVHKEEKLFSSDDFKIEVFPRCH